MAEAGGTRSRRDCDWGDATDGDPGGVSGGTSYPENPIQYEVVFQARDERLKLWDNRTDGRAAEAYLIINSPNGGYVERDILRTGSERTFELGTPDGSGNDRFSAGASTSQGS